MAVLEVEKLGAEHEAGRTERRQGWDIEAVGPSIWAILEEIEGFYERDESSHSGCWSVRMAEVCWDALKVVLCCL